MWGKETTHSSLRHARFQQMVSENSKFQPESLPPTERAIVFHSFRVHLQTCIWKYLDLHCLDPLHWGWKMVDGKLLPIKTDIEAAPEYLLNVVRCNCRLTSSNPCGASTKCSCKLNGLSCVSACGNCRGVSCLNIGEERTGIEVEDGDEPINNGIDD